MEIEKFFPQWLADRRKSLKNHQADFFESLENCQVVRSYRQVKEFCHSYPVIAMFLAIVFCFGFLPLIVFVSFVFGSFVVIFFTALTVFAGVLGISLVPLLAVVVPILMLGGVLAIFVYISYCCVKKIRLVVKRFKGLFLFKPPSRIHGKRIWFAGHRVKPHTPQQRKEEGTFVDELLNHSHHCF